MTLESTVRHVTQLDRGKITREYYLRVMTQYERAIRYEFIGTNSLAREDTVQWWAKLRLQETGIFSLDPYYLNRYICEFKKNIIMRQDYQNIMNKDYT